MLCTAMSRCSRFRPVVVLGRRLGQRPFVLAAANSGSEPIPDPTGLCCTRVQHRAPPQGSDQMLQCRRRSGRSLQMLNARRIDRPGCGRRGHRAIDRSSKQSGHWTMTWSAPLSAGRGLWTTRSGPAVRGREVLGEPSGFLYVEATVWPPQAWGSDLRQGGHAPSSKRRPATGTPSHGFRGVGSACRQLGP